MHKKVRIQGGGEVCTRRACVYPPVFGLFVRIDGRSVCVVQRSALSFARAGSQRFLTRRAASEGCLPRACPPDNEAPPRASYVCDEAGVVCVMRMRFLRDGEKESRRVTATIAHAYVPPPPSLPEARAAAAAHGRGRGRASESARRLVRRETSLSPAQSCVATAARFPPLPWPTALAAEDPITTS